MQKKESRTMAAKTKDISKLSNKMLVCLEHLYQLGYAGMNTLEAKALYDDTCLHTTVSQISEWYGIKLERQYETLTNREGRPTRFMRYWLNKEQRKIVAELLGFTKKGNAL